MKQNYDYVLIDSRTGLSDVADICTVHLPDVVVDCFTLATQGIEGAAMIARMIQGHTEREITILPVPMRIDHRRRRRWTRVWHSRRAVRGTARRNVGGAATRILGRGGGAVPAVVRLRGDARRLRRPARFTDWLLSSYERIAARITRGAVSTLPPREEWLRLRTRLLFSRTQRRARPRLCSTSARKTSYGPSGSRPSWPAPGSRFAGSTRCPPVPRLRRADADRRDRVGVLPLPDARFPARRAA